MALVNVHIVWDEVPGSYGTLVEYRLQDGTIWTTPTSPTNPTLEGEYDIELESGNYYYIRLTTTSPTCASSSITKRIFVPGAGACCPYPYTLSPDESYCYQEETVAPTVIQSNICLAISQLVTQYSSAGTALYDPGYTIRLVGSSTSLLTTYWKEQVGQVTGPMNREGVWVDTDCNGTKDGLTSGQVLQLSFDISTPVAKTVYVGMGGDNTFKMVLNGTTIVDCDTANPAQGGPSSANFNIWHVFPVDLVSGPNHITFSGVGDGSTNDSFAAVIYDNDAAEISAASSDGDLTILFSTSDLIGDHIDIATCPATYTLDTSGGPGAYTCRRITTTATIPC